jgi:hypothetical protein
MMLIPNGNISSPQINSIAVQVFGDRSVTVRKVQSGAQIKIFSVLRKPTDLNDRDMLPCHDKLPAIFLGRSRMRSQARTAWSAGFSATEADRRLGSECR